MRHPLCDVNSSSSQHFSHTSCLFKAPASSDHNKQLPLLQLYVFKVITFRKRRHTVRKGKRLRDSLAGDISYTAMRINSRRHRSGLCARMLWSWTIIFRLKYGVRHCEIAAVVIIRHWDFWVWLCTEPPITRPENQMRIPVLTIGADPGRRVAPGILGQKVSRWKEVAPIPGILLGVYPFFLIPLLCHVERPK